MLYSNQSSAKTLITLDIYGNYGRKTSMHKM